jgi:hypothetical protein
MCWFEGGITRSGGAPEPIAGLGLLPGSFSVHADSELERLPVFRDSIRAGLLPGGWAADDDTALFFRERQLEQIVAARPGPRVVRCDAIDGELVTTPILPGVLNGGPGERPPPPDDVLELRSVAGMRRGSVRDPWFPRG